jgi:hypothetical protein
MSANNLDSAATRWTKLAQQCYRIESDCSRCEIPNLKLSYPCQVGALLPRLLEKYGKPVQIHCKGRTMVVGEKQRGSVNQQPITFCKPHYQWVLDQIIRYPVITAVEIQKNLCLAKWLVHDALVASFNLGIIEKRPLRKDRIRYQQWFYIGNLTQG